MTPTNLSSKLQRLALVNVCLGQFMTAFARQTTKR
jgi:hypothetical protein